MKRLLAIAMVSNSLLVSVIVGMEKQKVVAQKKVYQPKGLINYDNVRIDKTGNVVCDVAFTVKYNGTDLPIKTNGTILGFDNNRDYLLCLALNSVLRIVYDPQKVDSFDKLPQKLSFALPKHQQQPFNGFSDDQIKKYAPRYDVTGSVSCRNARVNDKDQIVSDISFVIQYDKETVDVCTTAELVGTTGKKKYLVYKVYNSYFTTEYAPKVISFIDAFVDKTIDLKIDRFNSLSQDEIVHYIAGNKIKPDSVTINKIIEESPKTIQLSLTFGNDTLVTQMKVVTVGCEYDENYHQTFWILQGECSIGTNQKAFAQLWVKYDKSFDKDIYHWGIFSTMESAKRIYLSYFDKNMILTMLKK